MIIDKNKILIKGVTVHFVKSWKLESKFLALKHTPKQHTSENLIKELKEVTDTWSITNKVMAVSADGASNIKKVILKNFMLRKLLSTRL